jgi:hypothetical protein
MSEEEKRLSVIEKYKTLLGRNNYSQIRRDFCFKPFKDGQYYSDCSSSVSFSYNEAGFNFGNMTTINMIISKKLKDIDVIIKDGIIQNPEVLKIADLLLFAGGDINRKDYEYVGHVEMIANINPNEITLYGHGGKSFPKEKEMNAFCKQRFETKVDTPLGHKGLIRVRRFIFDEDNKDDNIIEDKIYKSNEKVIGIGTALMNMNVREGPGTEYNFVSYVEKDEKVEVLEILKNGWLRINCKKQKKGFAYTSNIKGKYYIYEECPNL